MKDVYDPTTFSDIGKIHKTTVAEKANEYLDQGWVLLGIWPVSKIIVGEANPIRTLAFVVGAPRALEVLEEMIEGEKADVEETPPADYDDQPGD